MNILKIGSKAPSFDLLNQNGEKISLKSLKGKRVVLYFYPRAMTPGCTVQACGLRDLKNDLDKHNAVAVGISTDDPKKILKFTEKENLNFDLLSDTDLEIVNKYGVWQLKKFMGRESMGVVRSTFILDEEGKIIHIMDKVKTKTHHQDVLEFLKARG